VVEKCSSGSRWALALVLVAGCAARREARVRRNWNNEELASTDPAGEPGGPTDEGADAVPTAIQKQGWERVEELLDRTTDVLVTAPSPQVLAELAAKWCEVEPIPRQTIHGQVRVCYLYPPVRVKGVALTLELSETGIVGFVAPELDEAKSRELADAAQSSLGHLCERSWTAARDLELKTCTIAGGSTLAVGRIRADPVSDRWQVSVAVLGAI